MEWKRLSIYIVWWGARSWHESWNIRTRRIYCFLMTFILSFLLQKRRKRSNGAMRIKEMKERNQLHHLWMFLHIQIIFHQLSTNNDTVQRIQLSSAQETNKKTGKKVYLKFFIMIYLFPSFHYEWNQSIEPSIEWRPEIFIIHSCSYIFFLARRAHLTLSNF